MGLLCGVFDGQRVEGMVLNALKNIKINTEIVINSSVTGIKTLLNIMIIIL